MPPNENCLNGLQCPECGSYEPFSIEIRMQVPIYDAGFEWPRSEDHNPYWDDDSACSCEACGHDGSVRDFEVKDEDSSVSGDQPQSASTDAVPPV